MSYLYTITARIPPIITYKYRLDEKQKLKTVTNVNQDGTLYAKPCVQSKYN